MNKYDYYIVIQGNYGCGFDDEDYHETNSNYVLKDRKSFKDNLSAYQAASVLNGGIIRTIKRREINHENISKILYRK